VEILQGDRGPDTESEDADVILRITRPDLTDCPPPPAAIADWLKPGWQNIDGSADVHPSRNVPAIEGGARVERFEDALPRPSLLKRWQLVRAEWQSQCDPTAMFALYLGHQTIIVGDDEQVTPVAVGVEMEQVQKLIQVHLQGIPHMELYDGEFSVYEFAQIAFGGVIRLVEHFRCAPNIIAFSNTLSYKGEIKPLREASAITLYPHVLPYRIEGGRGGNDGVNDAEAEVVASLICAAIEQPEYTPNDADKPTSFGVVSLVGAQQAMKVDGILRQRLEPAEYKRRQILCGDPAQFQGDERDVMVLSMVDTPPADPPLPMRQEGPKKIFKKRFNVAASRARDQMWVVHSLNHEVDLKPDHDRFRILFVGGKEESGVEYSLETGYEAFVVASVFGKAERFEDGRCRAKTNDAGLVPSGHGRDPDQQQAVLAERETVIRVSNDSEPEPAIVAGVFQRVLVWSANWNPTEHERPGTESAWVLTTIRATDLSDGIQLPDLTFCDAHPG